MSAAANAVDQGWEVAESVDDGWVLDEPVVFDPPRIVLTIVADYAEEWEADIEIVDDGDDGWAISGEEAAFFAEGDALATARRPPTEDFSDLGSVKPDKGFWKRLLRRSV